MLIWISHCLRASLLTRVHVTASVPGSRHQRVPFPGSLSSVMDQALVCLFFWMMLWAHWRWGPCLNLRQTLNPVGFSLLLRAHLLESKSFVNHLPYFFFYFLISVSWNCLQMKVLVLEILNQVTSGETQAKMPRHTRSGHVARSGGFQASAQSARESQTLTSLLLPPWVWLWLLKAICFFWSQEEWDALNQKDQAMSVVTLNELVAWI